MKMFPLFEQTTYLDRLQIRVSTQCLREKNYPHLHKHIQICYVLSGTLKHIINGREYVQTSDSCSFILPYICHMTDLVDSEDTPVVVFISFNENFLQNYGYDFFPYMVDYANFEGYQIPRFFEYENDAGRELVHKMIDEFSHDVDMNYTYMAKLVSDLIRLSCTEKAKKLPGKVLKTRVSDINKAVSAMREHYAEKLTIDDMASLCNMSRSTFTTNFKTITGLSFIDFLSSIRISAAKNLYLSVASHNEIAERTGLQSRTNLTRVFKKYLGVSLLEFRKNHENSKPKFNAKSNTLLEWLYEDE